MFSGVTMYTRMDKNNNKTLTHTQPLPIILVKSKMGAQLMFWSGIQWVNLNLFYDIRRYKIRYPKFC